MNRVSRQRRYADEAHWTDRSLTLPALVGLSLREDGGMTSTITMSPLEVVEGIAVFRVDGRCRLPYAVALIGSAGGVNHYAPSW